MRRDVVFISYSHADRDWLTRLLVLLSPAVRNRRLEPWADPYIEIGNQWRRDISEALRRSQIAVLLISGDFLASPFIMNEELPALRAAGVRLVPVLVHPCLWEEEPALRDVQWAHDPRRDGPLDRDNDVAGERDRKLTALCRRMLEIVPGDTTSGREPLIGDVQIAPQGAEPLVASPMTAHLDRVPTLPTSYVARDDVAVIGEQLLSGASAAIGLSGILPGVGLSGQGGIGKSVLAAAVAHDSQIARHFPDGVFWVTLGDGADVLAAQLDLLARLDVNATARSLSEAVHQLRQALHQRACLILVDDVWSVGAARAFAVATARSRVLYTARDPAVLTAAGATLHPVDVLPAHVARCLLATTSGTSEIAMPRDAESVLLETGRVALAVALVGAAVKGGTPWSQVLDQLRAGRHIYGGHPYATTFKALNVAASALDRDSARAYLSLAVYPADTAVSMIDIARFWERLWNTTKNDSGVLLSSLAEKELLILDESLISFHDLQHDYLLLHADDLSVLHADLLAAYHISPPASGAGWSELLADEPYIRHHLVDHLCGAGATAELVRTVTDAAYLITRAFIDGPHAAEADLRKAAQVSGDPQLGWWQHWFAIHGHLVTDLPSLGDTAATATIRLRTSEAAQHAARLRPLLPHTHLSPRWGLTSERDLARRVLAGHTAPVSGVSFSPDGRLLASAGEDGTVRLWDPAAGTERATFTGHIGWVNCVAFSPDGRLLASGGQDGTVRLWNLATGSEQVTFTGQTAAVRAVTLSPDGQTLVSADQEGTIRLWDPASGTERATLTGHAGPAYAAAFSPDGRLLASAGQDGTVRLWVLGTGVQQATLTGHGDRVNDVAFSPDGKLLASGGEDGAVRLWDISTGTESISLAARPIGWVASVAFSPDGQLLASGGQDGTVRLWDPVDGNQTAVLTGHTKHIEHVEFDKAGLLASSSGDGTIRLWDPTTSNQAAVLGHASLISHIAFSPDGQLLASGSHDGTVRLWQTSTGSQQSSFAGHIGWVNGVAFSPDGRLLASAGDDGTIRLWDPTTGHQRARLTGHAGWPNKVAFSPDGRLLASGGEDGTIRLWDPITQNQTAVLTGHTRWIGEIAFSPDGRLLASAGYDGVVRLWDPTTGGQTAILNHNDIVQGVAFDVDARLLASGSNDGIVRLWDPTTGNQMATLTGHRGWVNAVAFSPDGQTLASAGHDGTVRIWDPTTGLQQHIIRLGDAASALAWYDDLLAVAVGSDIIVLSL